MSKEKQIEEMAKVIDAMEGGNAYTECFDNAFADADKIAEVLYNAGYRKQSEKIICGNSVERWKVKINRFVLDGLRQGATTTVIAEYIVDSILEEAICAVREDEECRKQSEGRWEKRVFVIFDSEKVGYRCSECNTTWDTQTPYCPNCGARMKGGAEETQVTTKKFFSPEEVRKMSQREVLKNYRAIMDSMKKWK